MRRKSVYLDFMTATQIQNAPVGIEFQPAIRQMASELASIQAGCDVHTLFRPSWTDNETGVHGVRGLVSRILSQAGACLVRWNGAAETRPFYVQAGLKTDDIIGAIRSANGFDKYPDKAILDRLTQFTREGWIGAVQLRSSEDKERKSKRPRKVWHLITEPIE